jgi:ADP-ribose pyrophosphatase
VSPKKQSIFEGRIISVALENHPLPDGREVTFEMVRHPGGAAALPVLEDGRIILIRQFRPAADGMVWEIPAGKLEPGEDPADCIRREMEEEVGYRPAEVEPLGSMLSAIGFCDERVYLYIAKGLTAVESSPEADEFIEPATMSLEAAMQMLKKGEIIDAKTQLALLLAERCL